MDLLDCSAAHLHLPAGGWHPDDHAEFERILAACRGDYAHCVQLAPAELGLLHSQEDIARHARWLGGRVGGWVSNSRLRCMSVQLSMTPQPKAHP